MAAFPQNDLSRRAPGAAWLQHAAAGVALVLLMGFAARLVGCGGSELGGTVNQPGKPAIRLPAGCPVGSLPCQYFCVPEGVACPSPDGGSTASQLSNVVFSAGTLRPAFSPAQKTYTLVIPGGQPTTLRVTPTTVPPGNIVYINGSPVQSGTTSSPIAIGLGVMTLTIALDASGTAGSAYQIVVQRSSYAKASNPGSGDVFGTAIALSGDTLAIAAPQEDSAARGSNGDQSDNSASDAGAVYVFVRSATGWAQQAYLKAPNADAGDRFGSAVALSGDTLVVGASGEDSGSASDPSDNSLAGSGAAYVFVRVGGVWNLQAYLKAAHVDAADAFGFSVAIAADTLAIGATGEASRATGVNGDPLDNGAFGSGAVYVFVRSGDRWTQQAYVKASNSDASDAFGYSVALDAETLAVGAPGESSSASGINGNQADNSSASSGAAYVFARTGDSWAQQAYVKAANTGAKDLFGRSVTLSADSLVVGAPAEASDAVGINGNPLNDNALRSGAAYVFARTASVWMQQAYVKASNTGASDVFGSSVSIVGDWLAVGAPGEASYARGAGGDQTDNRAPGSGAVYLFQRSGTGWAQQLYLKATNTASQGAFGSAVALTPEMLVCGAPGDSNSGTGINDPQSSGLLPQSGAAYISDIGP